MSRPRTVSVASPAVSPRFTSFPASRSLPDSLASHSTSPRSPASHPSIRIHRPLLPGIAESTYEHSKHGASIPGSTSLPPIRGVVSRLLRRGRRVSPYNAFILFCFFICLVLFVGTLSGVGYTEGAPVGDGSFVAGMEAHKKFKAARDAVPMPEDSPVAARRLVQRAIWDETNEYTMLPAESDYATHSAAYDTDTVLEGPTGPIPTLVSQYMQAARSHHMHFHSRILDNILLRFLFPKSDEQSHATNNGLLFNEMP